MTKNNGKNAIKTKCLWLLITFLKATEKNRYGAHVGNAIVTI